jgi:copper(I)-binding protein
MLTPSESAAEQQGEIRMKPPAFTLFLLALASCSEPSSLEVKNPWTRDTVGSVANAAVFMTISSPSADRLISASTSVATKADLMTMGRGGNVMEMKYVQGIDIPANTPVSLDPNGLHIWLAQLNQPLKAGETFPLDLKFEKAGQRRVTITVIKPADAPPKS